MKENQRAKLVIKAKRSKVDTCDGFPDSCRPRCVHETWKKRKLITLLGAKTNFNEIRKIMTSK